jgi:hypothetical protein
MRVMHVNTRPQNDLNHTLAVRMARPMQPGTFEPRGRYSLDPARHGYHQAWWRLNRADS